MPRGTRRIIIPVRVHRIKQENRPAGLAIRVKLIYTRRRMAVVCEGRRLLKIELEVNRLAARVRYLEFDLQGRVRLHLHKR